MHVHTRCERNGREWMQTCSWMHKAGGGAEHYFLWCSRQYRCRKSYFHECLEESLKNRFPGSADPAGRKSYFANEAEFLPSLASTEHLLNFRLCWLRLSLISIEPIVDLVSAKVNWGAFMAQITNAHLIARRNEDRRNLMASKNS